MADASSSSPVLSLTPEESALFDFLLDVVAHNGLEMVLRVAGGWVRDKVLCKQSDDIDIALDTMTGISFAQLVNARLIELGKETHSLGVIHANPEQSKHLETVSLRVLGFDLDLVNLRSETYAEGSRIPTVEFGTPYSDAVRRDLTINALFYNLTTRQVEDLCGRGLEDLRAMVCRTPLSPRHTFLDDPLRVLRAVRFATRLGFDLAPELVAAARTVDVQHALRVKVSRERVLIEMDKMLTSLAPAAALRFLRCMGLLSAVFVLPDGCAHARPCASTDAGADAAVEVAEWPPPDADADARARAQFDDACAGCVEGFHLALGGPVAGAADAVPRQPMLQIDPAPEVRRIAWLAAAMLPLRALVVPSGKRPKPIALAEVTLRTALPGMASADIAQLLRLHASVPELAGWCSSVERAAEPSRLQLGLRLREAGSQWPVALALALVVAAPPFNTAAVPSCADLDADKLSAAQSAWVQSARAHTAAAELLCRRVDELGLRDVHALRPLLTGEELMREAGLAKGPAVGRASREVLEFQLANRNATRQDALAFLQSLKPS